MKQSIKKYIQKLPRRKPFHFEGFCPNCEYPVNGNYCTNCGQSLKDFHRPFWSVLGDSVSDALSIDNKFVHTIIPLLIRPGYLTKEFMRGRRAKYTPPFRLYLFLTFFAFLLLVHNHKPETDAAKNLTFENEKGNTVDLISMLDNFSEEKETNSESSLADSIATKENQKELLTLGLTSDSLVKNQSSKRKIEVFGEELQNSNIKRMTNMWRLNPSLMMDTAFKKLSQTLLLILPLFALFLALLYLRRKYYLIEHLLISLNFHSFIFIVVIISELLIMTGIEILHDFAFYLYLLIPFQLLLAMKFYYRQSWIKTIFKFFILSFIYNIMLISGIFYSLISLAV